jgi:DNA-binding LacI/PurR family transcriptional regulator
MQITKPLEELRKAEGFKANMIGTITILWLGYQLVKELFDQNWIEQDILLQRAVVSSVVALIGSIVYLTVRWLRTHRDTKLKHVFVAFPSMENEPFHVEVLRGITEKLSSEYTITLWLPQHGSKYMGGAFEVFLRKIKKDSALYVGGIVLPTEVDHNKPEELSSIMHEIGKPIVIVDTLPEAFLDSGTLKPGQQFIGFDNIQGGTLAAQAMSEELKLMQIDPERILILHAKEQHARHESFIEEFRRLHPNVEFALDECGWDREIAREKVKSRIKHGILDNYQGVFGCNDEMAIGAIEAIADEKFDFKRLVVIGYDGTPCSKALMMIGNTALRNTVVQDGYKLGAAASERLLRSVGSASEPELEKPEYMENILEKPYY